MSTTGWIVVVVLIVVVAAAIFVVIVDGRRRQRARIADRFGPEYERSVARNGDRRQAEQELADRVARRDQLDVRPLDPESRRSYASRWQSIQSQFVDDPPGSIQSADRLLDEVMRQRGYPVDDFEEKAALISVDHPVVVENYRTARQTRQQTGTGHVLSTARLRDTLLNYRALFDELLEAREAQT